jgi:hypothetical protein
VRGVLRPTREYAVELRSRVASQKAHFLFRVRDTDDHPVTGLTGRAEWRSGANSADHAIEEPTVTWKQARPGEYIASMPLSAATASRPLILSLTGEAEAVRYCAYPPELPVGERSGAGADFESARNIAEAGRGIVSNDYAVLAESCKPKVSTVRSQEALWPWLIALAILLWPIDVFFRKLA